MAAGTTPVKIYYGRPMLPDVSRVLACLYEKEVQFQLVDMHEGRRVTLDLLKLQGSSPAHVLGFEDGATTLFESRAICRYISDKYAGQGNTGLLGRDLLERASIEQWLRCEEQSFEPPSWALVFNLAFAPMAGLPVAPPDRRIADDHNRRKLAEVLDVYDRRLGKSKYLAGNEFTLADLAHLPNSHYIAASGELGHLFEARRNVSRWWRRISGRGSWRKVVEILDRVDGVENAAADDARKKNRPEGSKKPPPRKQSTTTELKSLKTETPPAGVQHIVLPSLPSPPPPPIIDEASREEGPPAPPPRQAEPSSPAQTPLQSAERDRSPEPRSATTDSGDIRRRQQTHDLTKSPEPAPLPPPLPEPKTQSTTLFSPASPSPAYQAEPAKPAAEQVSPTRPSPVIPPTRAAPPTSAPPPPLPSPPQSTEESPQARAEETEAMCSTWINQRTQAFRSIGAGTLDTSDSEPAKKPASEEQKTEQARPTLDSTVSTQPVVPNIQQQTRPSPESPNARVPPLPAPPPPPQSAEESPKERVELGSPAEARSAATAQQQQQSRSKSEEQGRRTQPTRPSPLIRETQVPPPPQFAEKSPTQIETKPTSSTQIETRPSPAIPAAQAPPKSAEKSPTQIETRPASSTQIETTQQAPPEEAATELSKQTAPSAAPETAESTGIAAQAAAASQLSSGKSQQEQGRTQPTRPYLATPAAQARPLQSSEKSPTQIETKPISSTKIKTTQQAPPPEEDATELSNQTAPSAAPEPAEIAQAAAAAGAPQLSSSKSAAEASPAPSTDATSRQAAPGQAAAKRQPREGGGSSTSPPEQSPQPN